MIRFFLSRAILFVVVLFIAGTIENAMAVPSDSLNIAFKRVDSLGKTVDTLKRKTDTINSNIKGLAAALKKDTTKTAACNVCIPNQNGTVETLGWIIVLLPAVLFIFLLLWLMNKGLKDFSLKEAMSENTYPNILVDNPQYNNANLVAMAAKDNLDDLLPPTIEKTYLIGTTTTVPGTTPPVVNTTFSPPPPNPSISRYIAFITSILTIVVALGVSCFYIYHYIRTGCPPELTGISTLLIALGIGVLPYIFNKISGAIGKPKNNTI